MTAAIPRQWASNSTFSGGAHAGETTKVDPGSAIAGNGFYPDLGFAAEHVNHQWSAMSVADRRAMMIAALQLRTLQRFGDTIDDVSESLAALQLGKVALVLKANTGGVFSVSTGIDRYGLLGALNGITSGVKGAAILGSRIVAFGSSGSNFVSYSDNSGVTWAAGANTGISGTRGRIVADVTNSKFVVSTPSSNTVKNSADATSWGSHNTGLNGVAGLASTPANLVALDEDANALAHSTDGGTTWASVTGVPANSGSFDESGDLVGDGSATMYHAARLNSGATVQISSGTISGATATWSTLASIPCSPFSDFGARPRLLLCPDTGLLVLVCKMNSSTAMGLWASLDGVDWVGPISLLPGADYAVDGFAVAGGRLFAAHDDQLFASDGIAT